MITIRGIIITITLILFRLFSSAQDIQYSQFYANALNLSPAFAGANQTSRIIMHGRLQWPALDATYIGSTFSFDHYFDNVKSGVGLLLNTDYMKGYSNQIYKNLNVGLQYAYQLELTEALTFRPGLQLSFIQQTFNKDGLKWDSQFNNQGFFGGPTGEENTINNGPVIQPDVSAGGLFYTDKLWVGISAHHLNRPTMSFIKNGDNKMNIHSSLHAGMKFVLSGNKVRRYGFNESDIETSITPVILYKLQNKADQLDMGIYFRYNNLVLGSWYRGIPLKVYQGEKFNHDALIFLLGATFSGFNIGYSYDLTVSKLILARSGGSHEISLTYNFLIKSYPQKKRPKNRKPVCPKF